MVLHKSPLTFGDKVPGSVMERNFHPEGMKSISPALTRPGRGYAGYPNNQYLLRRSSIIPKRSVRQIRFRIVSGIHETHLEMKNGCDDA
jgi:hypothetical protein